MPIKPAFQKPDIKTLQMWVSEAHWGSLDWRAESWRDEGMYDGAQWDQDDANAASEAGIEMLTINRTFPVINLILGTQAINKYDILAKARTQDDSELSQTMSEAIQFVMDQSDGSFLVGNAFRDAIVPGFGCLSPGFHPDPRKEKVRIAYRDWKEIWWDPFASPWFSPLDCRYVFHQRWMDLSALQAMFPKKEQELSNYFSDVSGGMKSEWSSIFDDEASLVEEEARVMSGSDWADLGRTRVRPVEMWYTIFDKAWFALFADGRVIELRQDMEPMEQYQVIQTSREVVSATIRRVRVATFLGEILLQDLPTPYPHDQFPFIPFVGYIDRYKHPYGVPRQIRDQNIEVNKRRSMAMALLSKRRTTVEDDVAGDKIGLQKVFEEANKPDGFVVVGPGKINSIKIEEHQQLAESQVSILRQSEIEIQQISGANDEQLGYPSRAESGRAIEKRQRQGATVTAPLFNNLRRSTKLLGEQVISLVQGAWTGEKVLRITDRLTGAEKFVAINEPVQGPGGQVVLKNNITQGKYDLIVSDAPQTDTVRERNLDLIIEWVKKSPPEIIPQLMQLAFEMSNIPNKEQLLARLRPLLGVAPGEEDLSAEEIKQKTIEQLEAQKQAQQVAVEIEQRRITLELDRIEAETEKVKAETRKILQFPQIEREKVAAAKSKLELEGFKTGFDMQAKADQARAKEYEGYQKKLNQGGGS